MIIFAFNDEIYDINSLTPAQIELGLSLLPQPLQS